jgi:MFS transporter, DHA1 family, inner membrane transport protein
MVAGGLVGAVGALLIGLAPTVETILLAGLVMAVGSALFSGANWAASADLAPPDEAARFMAIANFGTAGAAAAAGLFGPLADIGRAALPALGYGIVPVAAAVPLIAGAFVAYSLRGAAARPPHGPLLADSKVTP